MLREVQVDSSHGVVTKPVGRDRLICEVRMTRSAYELARRGTLFRVPNVLDYDLAGQWIKLEYIPNTVPLHRLLHSHHAPFDLFERVGKIAAEIHRDLTPPHQNILGLPPEFDHVGPKAFLHGDLNLINVRYDAEHDQLVLFDWSASPLIGGAANWGTVYWDVANFVRATLTAPPIRLTGRTIRRQLADRFLKSYVDHSGHGPLGRPFFDYCRKIHEFYSGKDKARLAWYRYVRYAALNLSNCRRYLNKKIEEGYVFS
jgi:hypothetical protein